MIVGQSTYVVLGELHVPADAGDVDDARLVAGFVFAPLCEEARERRGNEEDRRGVDGVHLGPCFEGLVVEERTPQGLGRLVLGCIHVVKEARQGSGLTCTTQAQ